LQGVYPCRGISPCFFLVKEISMTVAIEEFKKDALFGGDVIHSYTRAEAIAECVLMDVTETAKEAGGRVASGHNPDCLGGLCGVV
jgi:hypothetical protein